jgi:hypothetical protein
MSARPVGESGHSVVIGAQNGFFRAFGEAGIDG